MAIGKTVRDVVRGFSTDSEVMASAGRVGIYKSRCSALLAVDAGLAGFNLFLDAEDCHEFYARPDCEGCMYLAVRDEYSKCVGSIRLGWRRVSAGQYEISVSVN